MARKILIIEDDAWQAQFYERALKSSVSTSKMSTEVVSNALDAMSSIERKLPDVIILDLLLPAVSGFGLLNELQSHSDTAQIPVVIISNLSSEEFEKEELANYGVVDVLSKTEITPSDVGHAVIGALV